MDGDLEIIAGSGESLEVLDMKDQGYISNYWNTYRGNNKRNGLYIFEENLSLSEFPSLPSEFNIIPAYPNPFNPIINIQYEIPSNQHLTIRIIDINGRVVTEVLNNYHSPGYYKTYWKAGGYSSGIYFIQYILQEKKSNTHNAQQSEKVVLLK